MKKRLSLAIWFFISLAARSHAAIEHVLVISVDGLRGDFLKAISETAPAEVPNFRRLQTMGAATFNGRCCHTWSYTVGNHLSMLTGRPVLQALGVPDTEHHGYFDNYPPADANFHALGNPLVPYKCSIFDVVHDRGLTTAAYIQKVKLTMILASYDANRGAADVIGVDNGRNKIDVATVPADVSPVPALLTAIQNNQLANFTFVHFADPDVYGHAYGWSNDPGSPYRLSIQLADAKIGTILDKLQANANYAGKYALVVLSDHGGGATNPLDHGDTTQLGDVIIPIFIVAPGVTGGTNAYDWFENRFDPGTEIPAYTNPWQPLRTLDAANLAANLLGLPAVPGSMARPVFKHTPVVARGGGQVTVSWPLYAAGQTLEFCDDLLVNDWQPVSGGISQVGAQWRHLDTAPGTGRRFFRLRGP